MRLGGGGDFTLPGEGLWGLEGSSWRSTEPRHAQSLSLQQRAVGWSWQAAFSASPTLAYGLNPPFLPESS